MLGSPLSTGDVLGKPENPFDTAGTDQDLLAQMGRDLRDWWPGGPNRNPLGKTTGQSQAEKDAQAYAQTVAALQAEQAALAGDSEAIKLNSSLRAAHAAEGSKEAAVITQLVQQNQDMKDAQSDLKIAAEAENAERTKALSLLDSLQSKTAAYASTQAELGKYLTDNIINQKQYNDALEELRIREVANDPVMKAAEKEAKEFNDAIGTLASSLGQDLLRGLHRQWLCL